MSELPIITRMPPSPTGYVHVGNVRTLLFNYLFAKQHGGQIVFRSEDTDRARSTREFEDANVADLSWLGLSWDAFYRQSERTEIYTNYLEQLIAADTAYLSTEPSKNDPTKMVTVVRLRNPNKDITFVDLIRGEITFNTTELGDLVIARAIDDPLYHFTVVVDDHDMHISHVIRGEDHISNTPRQILIQEALGFTRPQYAHLPIILGPDKTKLSKRHGSVSLRQYREAGYLPAAITNYLALLGWNPGTDQEIFSLEELITQFSLKHIQKGSAIFNSEKFRWINREHLHTVPDTQFAAAVRQWLPLPLIESDRFEERFMKLLPEIKDRIAVYEDVAIAAEAGEYDWAFLPISYDTTQLQWKNDTSVADAAPRLAHIHTLLQDADFSSPETIKAALWSYAEETGKGEVLWPLRVALTGLERSPDPFTCAYTLGKDETLSRITTACDKIAGDVAT